MDETVNETASVEPTAVPEKPVNMVGPVFSSADQPVHPEVGAVVLNGIPHETALRWFHTWFPENSPDLHPVRYLSNEFHYVRKAFMDLYKRLGGEDVQSEE